MSTRDFWFFIWISSILTYPLPFKVNGVQLYGKSRREAVSFLKEVPPPFTLVCCRRLFDDEASVDEPRTTEASLPETEVLNEYTVVPIGMPLHQECPDIQGTGKYFTLFYFTIVALNGNNTQLYKWLLFI